MNGVEELTVDDLTALLLAREDFIVYVEKYKSYYRPIWGAEPTVGHLCGYLYRDRSENIPIGYICRIDSAMMSFDAGDTVNEEWWLKLVEVSKAGYSPIAPRKFDNVDGRYIPCLFKRIETRLVDEYVCKRQREEW
jgi:hypothetical protein